MSRITRSDLVFFLSGFAALVYQVGWARLLSRLLGSDSIGVALVLFVFMAGMGVGALVGAGPVRRTRRPARLFFALSVAMAAWALASPALLEALGPVRELGLRGAVAAAVLFVPTAIMGATFPLMGRLVVDDDDSSGRDTGAFYGANTIGAACGALTAAFVVFPAVGLVHGIWVGALFDLAAGALALGLAARSEERTPAAPAVVLRGRSAALTATALFGASSLALEVLLTRLLIQVTGASVFAFAIVLFVFLVGIGFGGRRARARLNGPNDALTAVVDCALWIPVAGFGGLAFLRFQLGEADLFGVVANRMPSDTSTFVLWASQAFFAGLVLLPPAVGFGLALPACTEWVVRARGAWSREDAMGRLYATNTAGAAVGSLGTALVLLPLAGPRVATALAFALAFCAAPLARLAGGGPRRAAMTILGSALFGGALGAFALWPRPEEGSGRVLFHEVGRDSTVSVVESLPLEHGAEPVRSLTINGKVVATTAPVDLRLQRVLGALPGLLHGEPRRALVIGLGTGMTAGALAAFPALEELVVVEISSSVREGARSFAAHNGDVVDDPRTELVLADGRHALRLETRLYDVVTSDPIHPWTRGSSDLYALEHFREMAAHLSPGGVASQWLPLYQLSTEDVRTIVATFTAAFEHTSAWLTAYDLVLVGSPEPHPLQLPAELPPEVGALLSEAGVRGGLELAALLVADDAALEAFAAGTAPMREDHPRLEFRAPLSYLSGYATEVLAWAAASRPSAIPDGARERAREVRDLLEQFLLELPSGLSTAAERYGRRLLELPPLEGER